MENETVCPSCGAISYGSDKCPVCGTSFVNPEKKGKTNTKKKRENYKYYQPLDRKKINRLLLNGERIENEFNNDGRAVKKLRSNSIGSTVITIIIIYSIIFSSSITFLPSFFNSIYFDVITNLMVGVASPIAAFVHYRKFGIEVAYQTIAETDKRIIVVTNAAGGRKPGYIWFNEIGTVIIGNRDYKKLGDIYFAYFVPVKLLLDKKNFRSFGELSKWVKRSSLMPRVSRLVTIGPLDSDEMNRVREMISKKTDGKVSLTDVRINPIMKKIIGDEVPAY